MITQRHKSLFAAIMSILIAQNIRAHEPESISLSIFKRSIGALVGGGIGYWLSQFFNGEQQTIHENKLKFLADLALFVQSDEYAKGDSSRLFTHYYNGLNQLVLSTKEAELSLLQEFATGRSDQAQQKVLLKINSLEEQLRSSHEKITLRFRWLMAVFGGAAGAYFPFAHSYDECGCSGGDHLRPRSTYVANFASTTAAGNKSPNYFFS